MPLPTIEWDGGVNGRIRLIDQTLLPNELKYVYCDDIKSIWHAIKTLMVRGAPAIRIPTPIVFVFILYCKSCFILKPVLVKTGIRNGKILYLQ